MSTGAVPQRGAIQSPTKVDTATIATAPAYASMRTTIECCEGECMSAMTAQMRARAANVEREAVNLVAVQQIPHGIFMRDSTEAAHGDRRFERRAQHEEHSHR